MTDGFRCLLCGVGAGEAVYRGCRDLYLGTPFRVDYWRCGACALLQQHPLPADTSAFYASYPVHVRKSALYAAARRLVLGGIYFPLDREPAPCVLLDYGCGDGGFLEAHRDGAHVLLGFEDSVPQAARVAEALGLPVYADRERLLGEREGSVDVVTLHMVLEHLADPGGALRLAGRLLKPGGRLYAVVPHLDSWEARLFGRRWHNLDPPRHVFLPLPAHVERLAAACGFRLARHAPVAFPNGFAASVPAALLGRFRFPLFAAALPLGILLTRLRPSGSRAYWLERA